MRKGIADINVRTEVSQNIVNRFTEHMSSTEEKTQLGELQSSVSKSLTGVGKKIRALDTLGKDGDIVARTWFD